MAEKKKKGFFKKMFGGKPNCCSLELEEIDENNQEASLEKQSTEKKETKASKTSSGKDKGCCCSC
ncbi:MAG: hypothetical protein Q7J16_06735 [Candidatus Cloacimonadales bacterium]|nr:hypothetical protein [Candidatus Cloacimonadales bacterium]